MSQPKARAVSLKRFDEWLLKNRSRLWDWRGMKEHGRPSCEVKYLYPSFDTRSREIFYIKTASQHFEVREGEEFDGDILDLLEHRMDVKRAEMEKKYKEEYPDEEGI